MKKLIAVSILILTATTGCAVRVVRPPHAPPPPPPPPAVQRMTYEEAVQRAIQLASSRGFSSRVEDAHLTGNDVWKVKLKIFRGDARGRMYVELDAWNRNVLRSEEKIYYRDDDDDDDHGHHHGREHGDHWGEGRTHRASAVGDD